MDSGYVCKSLARLILRLVGMAGIEVDRVQMDKEVYRSGYRSMDTLQSLAG